MMSEHVSDDAIDRALLTEPMREKVIADGRARLKRGMSVCDLVDITFLEGKIPGLAPYRDERWSATIDGIFYKDYYK